MANVCKIISFRGMEGGGEKVSYNMSGVNIFSDGEMTGCPASFFHLQTNESRCAKPLPSFAPDE